MQPLLYLATKNAHKTRELRDLLTQARHDGILKQSYDVRDLSEFGDYASPEESGTTFEANALLKARALHAHLLRLKKSTSFAVLADDSGLECEDLGGLPGVLSARYAGPLATDAENNAKLIDDLKSITHLTRAARYACALAVIGVDGEESVFTEYCDGMILFSPKGKNGFGYDPYFYLPDQDKTMAELTPDEKNALSHRGKAFNKWISIC